MPTLDREKTRGLVLAAAACVLTTPVALWWLVGDLSAARPDLDYVIRAPQFGPWVERLAGAGSALIAAGTMFVLVRASRQRRFDRRWWGTILPLIAAGVLLGAGGRVVTAGAIGANIGAGVALLVGGPLAVLFVLWAAGWSAHLLRSRKS